MLPKTDHQYKNWILDLKQKIQQSQIKASIRVNSALIELYWDLGKEIAERGFENTYGYGFFKQLSNDLKKEFPEIKGFSSSNLRYMKQFYLFYNQYFKNFQQVAGELRSSENNLHQVGGELEKFDDKSLHQLGGDLQNSNRHQLGNDFPQKLFLIPWFHNVKIYLENSNLLYQALKR